jgi:hypothetical protein
LDAATVISVNARGQGIANVNGAAEFLMYLALECRSRLFPRLHFAAGELPVTCEVLSLGSLGQKDAILVNDDGTNDPDHSGRS